MLWDNSELPVAGGKCGGLVRFENEIVWKVQGPLGSTIYHLCDVLLVANSRCFEELG